MGKMRPRDVMKEVQKSQAKMKMENNPNTPLGLATSLRSFMPGKRGGYLNALNRLQKKLKAPLKGIPGCGKTVRDWLTGYE